MTNICEDLTYIIVHCYKLCILLGEEFLNLYQLETGIDHGGHVLQDRDEMTIFRGPSKHFFY